MRGVSVTPSVDGMAQGALVSGDEQKGKHSLTDTDAGRVRRETVRRSGHTGRPHAQHEREAQRPQPREPLCLSSSSHDVMSGLSSPGL